MVNVSEMLGDRSGRPDTSLVDREQAETYAKRMIDAVIFVRFAECRQIHLELNKDWALYTLALDLFREMCRQRGVSSGRFREYSHDG